MRPTVSDLPHVGDRIDPGLCVADCFETTFGYATPAYVSFDTPRSVALLYRSGRAKPYGRVSFDVTDATGTTTAFRLQVKDPAGTYVNFTNDTTALFFAKNTNGPTRVVAEFDAGAIATSAKLYTAYVTSYDGATMAGTTADTLRVIIVNGTASAFGAGVDLVGFQRLYDNASQTGGVLITDGSGAASFFRGSCAPAVSCTYTSPGGDFSVLTTGSNQYKRTYPDGTVVTFDATGNELSAVTRFGAATSFAYSTNVSGQVVPWAIGDGTGNTIDLRYRSASESPYKPGSLTTITAPTGGRRADFRVYTASGNLEQVLDFDNLSYSVLGYDTQHLLTGITDKKGYTWNYRYAYGRPIIDTVDAPSVEISAPSGPSTVRPRTLFREAYSGLYSAAATGGGRSVTSPIPVPAFDIRAAVTDPRGNSTFFSLNRFGSPRKTYAPLTPSDSVEYNDVTGQVTRTISPTGHEMVYSYYPSGLLRTRADNALGKLDSLWYETTYALVQAIKGTDGEQWFWHDTQKAGWPLTKTAPTSGGPFTWYYKDSRGRDSVIVDPSLHRVSYAYATSGLQNLVSVTAPNGQTTTYGRNAWGLVTSTTAPNLAKSTDSLDILNRRVWNAGQYGDTTRFTYNELDQLTVLKDAKGQVDSLKRNALGWVRSHVYANGAVDSTFFDSTGNVVRTKSRANREVVYKYDALGRLVTRTGAATQITDSLSYDPSGRWVTVRSRVGGTVLSTDTDSTNEALHISYSATVRPSGAWRLQREFHSNDPGISSAILYKQVNGNDVTAAYTNYGYDTQHRLASIRSANDTTGFTYNGENLVDSRSLSGNLGEAFTYTSGHELATRAYTNASWVEATLHRWYRTDSLQRITERGGSDSLFQAFTYDSAGRLRSWAKKAERSGTSCVNDGGYGYKCTGPTPWLFSQVSPTYDKVGNPHPSDTAVTTTGNRLTSYKGVAMTYDADGFLTTRVIGTTTDSLTWDEFGRLVSVKRVGGTTTTFTYDGMGRRISKTSAGTTVQYLWDGDQMIAELDGSGTIQKSYTYDGLDHPRSVTTGGETYFFSTEPDGTVDGLIRRGSDRTVAAQYAYTPWGELETAAQPFDSVSNLRWKGLQYDPETGFYYMRARYYDPKIRRFISEDPLGFDGGINAYAFANADPINGNDPSGLLPYVQNLPGWNTSAVGGFHGCWGMAWTSSDANQPFLSYAQQQCPSEPSIGAPPYEGPSIGARPQTTGRQLPSHPVRDKILSEQCGRAAVGLAFAGVMDAVTWGHSGILGALAKADMTKVVYIIGDNALTAARGLRVKNIPGTTIPRNTAAVLSRPMAGWMFTGAQTGIGSAISGSLPTLRDFAIGAFVPFGGTALAVRDVWNSCH
ncbi:MAG TPA: RHS repeat-associated core domain-containing protein [Gemmatimonadaceae bacterium]|nr:RHS repeat-associated core domain-containing protein [Gemmatimonadaceae bacterium]